MITLITKTHFYVRPVGPDGTARQEFVRLQPGAVLRQYGSDWQPGMPWQEGQREVYRVGIESGIDQDGNDWSGRRAYATPERFTEALVSSKMTPELQEQLGSLDLSSLVR
jgi:hypothetical protein